MKTRAKGVVTFLRAEERRPPNDKAAFVLIICADEDGDEWEFSAACFAFDMQPHAKDTNHEC